MSLSFARGQPPGCEGRADKGSHHDRGACHTPLADDVDHEHFEVLSVHDLGSEVTGAEVGHETAYLVAIEFEDSPFFYSLAFTASNTRHYTHRGELLKPSYSPLSLL